MANLQDAIAYLAKMASRFGEVVKSEPFPLENYPGSPFVATMPNYGRLEFVTMGPDFMVREDHWISMDIHVHRKDLPEDVRKLSAVSDDMRDALQEDITLGGSGYQVVELWYSYGPAGWNERNIQGELDTIAWKFSVRVRNYDYS